MHNMPTSPTATEKQDTEHVQTVTTNLNQAGHNVTPSQVTPVTHQTPVPNTPELIKAEAEIVGEDLSHLVTTTVEDVTGGQSPQRMTKSNRFLAALREKLAKVRK